MMEIGYHPSKDMGPVEVLWDDGDGINPPPPPPPCEQTENLPSHHWQIIPSNVLISIFPLFPCVTRRMCNFFIPQKLADPEISDRVDDVSWDPSNGTHRVSQKSQP